VVDITCVCSQLLNNVLSSSEVKLVFVKCYQRVLLPSFIVAAIASVQSSEVKLQTYKHSQACMHQMRQQHERMYAYLCI
jgi:hypothetical protein